MTHMWGLPDVPDDQRPGVNPALLVSSELQVETINCMPVMTATPVRLSPA